VDTRTHKRVLYSTGRDGAQDEIDLGNKIVNNEEREIKMMIDRSVKMRFMRCVQSEASPSGGKLGGNLQCLQIDLI
jgi:hypothetical protein